MRVFGLFCFLFFFPAPGPPRSPLPHLPGDHDHQHPSALPAPRCSQQEPRAGGEVPRAPGGSWRTEVWFHPRGDAVLAGSWLVGGSKAVGVPRSQVWGTLGQFGAGCPPFSHGEGPGTVRCRRVCAEHFGGELPSESPADVTTACAMGTGGLLGTRPAGGTRPRRGSAPLTHPAVLPSSVRAAPDPVRAPSGGRKGSACTPAAAASFLGASELLEEGLMSPGRAVTPPCAPIPGTSSLPLPPGRCPAVRPHPGVPWVLGHG